MLEAIIRMTVHPRHPAGKHGRDEMAAAALRQILPLAAMRGSRLAAWRVHQMAPASPTTQYKVRSTIKA